MEIGTSQGTMPVFDARQQNGYRVIIHMVIGDGISKFCLIRPENALCFLGGINV
jgi:hypothetical protein